MAINTRSPYFESYTIGNAVSVNLSIKIWTGDKTNDIPETFQYELNKKAINTGDTVSFEISELIRDYIETNFNGDYNSEPVWVYLFAQGVEADGDLTSPSISTQIAYDGYSYFENPDFDIDEESILITNRQIYALADNFFRVPINTNTNPTITFFKNNEVIFTETFAQNNVSSTQIKYVSAGGSSVNYDTYKERVLEDDGTFEDSKCLQSFFNSFEIGEADKIQVSDNNGVYFIDVKTIEECKYEPKKITFINKFGVLQDVYFFKKSVEKMGVKKESYKANILTSGNTYSISNHVNRDFNVVGKESISLSSGFLSEEYNEVFKQMLLSEKVWITNIIDTGEQVLPLNIKTSNITYKTSLNDRLIEYTIEFDNSFDTINNIR